MARRLADLLGRLYGWLWRLLWGDSVRYARERVELELHAQLLGRGITATTPKHVWYLKRSGFVVREGYAPADPERPYFLRGLTLDLCTARLRGTVVRQGVSRGHRH
jgi:hypothetical protein